MNQRNFLSFSAYTPYAVAFLASIAVPLRAIGVAPQQTALGLALIGTLFLFVRNADIRAQFFSTLKSPAGKSVVAIFMAWAITVPYSYAPFGSLEIGARTAGFVLAASMIWAALRVHVETHPLMIKTLVVAASIFTIAAVLSLNGVPLILSALKFKLLARENPIDAFKAYGAAAMCMAPAVIWAGRKLGGSWKWWGYAFAPMALAVAVGTQNRSAIVSFVAMSLVVIGVVAISRRKYTKRLSALGLSIVAGGIAWVYAENKWRPLTEGSYAPEWLIDSHRQIIWKFSFERFLDHPWVGNGIDQLNYLPGAKVLVNISNDLAYTLPSHPHNWALEILAETGLLGFSTVIIALAVISWKFLKNYLAQHNEADLALLTLWAGFWSSALFNFSIWATWWQLTLCIVFTLIASARQAPLKLPT